MLDQNKSTIKKSFLGSSKVLLVIKFYMYMYNP
jgi:hypothetical protein